MYHAGAGKELLAFGQAILVGEHNVRVERHLSQGGFAHVYLVRSDKPVGGTTQHVLKHIRVANEGMLNEVRKEVDIMRLLRGHPNIVHLIDAAWSKTPTGPSAYEVFILMEFCPGGGIIDMMNRRLRERLTEQEILQIFVDVCEALAFMHNLRPALLHRDLKVENILQASATKYKLCDFGSATPVAQRPPSTLQEIQALGADLDRHTTLQYRAPEMIDPNLRRPIDEKSDVWALGVLLYKLCYYTTPFEEHGPLAILNVQYTTPPYPVYSVQMNQLIGSMLQEYGAHRPSVFDLLDRVHAMRGTRSSYTYNRAPVAAIPAAPPKSSLDGILVRNQAAVASSGAGAAAARKQVLDAIAPMRRGRPEVQSQEDRAWEAVKAKDKVDDSAWDLAALNVKRVEAKSPAVVSPSAGFGDSFKPSIRNAHAPSSVASPPLPPSVYGTISPPPPATSTTPQPRPGTLSTPSYYPSALRAPSAPLQDTRKATPAVSGRPADVELSAEERFPSLEALDRAFSPPVASPPASNLGAPIFGRDQGPGLAPTPPLRGARSQQVTGVAMKDPSPPTLPPKPAMLPTGHAASAVSSPDVGARPSLRRHRSSVAIKSPVLASSSSSILQPKPPRKEREQPTDWLTGDQHESTHRREESRPGKLPQQDWLTGDFDEPQAPPAQVARSSLNGPRQMGPRPLPASPAKPARRSPSPKPPLPPRPAARADSPEPIKEETQSAFARASVFREETRSAFRHTGAQNGDSYLGARPLPSQPLQASPSAPAPVKTSPRETGLTDNWSPVEDRHPASHHQQQHGNSSSSDEEKGPEDATPARRSVLEPKQRKSKIRPKGRTSSVHDLVDLWSTDSGAAPTKTGDRLERPPSRQTGVGAGPKRSPGPSPVLRPTPAPQPPSPAKARPQSMFLYGSGGSTLSPPSQPPSNAFTALAHQTPSASASSPQNLAAPPQDASRARASRRGSISDMVEKYEALVTPRSPATPRWSPGGGGAGQVALPGLAAPSAAPVGRSSPGLSVQQRRVSTGRISPAGSATSVSTNTSTTSAFHGRQQPARKNTAPPASPSKAPSSPTKAAFNFASGYTGGAARTATPVMNPGTPKPAASHTPKPSGSSTPRPTTNFTGAKTTTTGTAPGAGAGVRNILTGTALRTTTTGTAGVKPVTTGSTGVKPVTTGNIAGINLKPITTDMGGVKTSTTGALRTPTSATAPFAPGHGRQSSTSVLFGKPSTPVPSSPVTLVSPIPLKPSSLSRRPGPPLKSITPPRDANGAPVAQPIASPTPDRPYTGVSKLIDQWQRKTEEAGAGAPRTGSYKSKG